MTSSRPHRVGLPGSFLISQGEKRGHFLRWLFFGGLVTAFAFPAAFIWWAFHMDPIPPQPGDSLPGLERLFPILFGIFFNPGWVMIAGSLTLNTTLASRYVAESQPGVFSPKLWQSCGRWRGWFFPGLDLLRNGSRDQGFVALWQWVHVALGWFFAIPFLPVIVFYIDPLTSSNNSVTILLVALVATIPFGIFSAIATGRLWCDLSTSKE